MTGIPASSRELPGSLNEDRDLKRRHYARAMELARMMGLTYQELSIWTSSVSWAVWMGDIQYGLQELAKIEIQREKMTDLGIQMAGVSYVEGDVLRFQGDLEKALPKYQQALEIYEETDNKLAFSNTIGATTWLLIESGQPDRLDYAYDLLQRSLEIEPNNTIHLCLIAQLFIKNGNLKEARNYLSKGQTAYQDNTNPWDHYWVHLIEAQLLASGNEWDRAWEAYQKTVELPVLNDYPWFMADTLKNWAEVLLSRGAEEDIVRARELLGQALAIFEDIGASGYVERVNEKIRELA